MNKLVIVNKGHACLSRIPQFMNVPDIAIPCGQRLQNHSLCMPYIRSNQRNGFFIKARGLCYFWTSNPHNENLSRELNNMWADMVVDIIERRINGTI